MISAFIALAIQGSNPDAEAVYAKLVAKLKPVKTISGKLEVATAPGVAPTKFTFKMMKPNFLREESETECYYIDGKNDWSYLPPLKEYGKGAAEPDVVGGMWLTGFESWLGGTQPEYLFFKLKEETVEGKVQQTIRMTDKYVPGVETRLVIDKATSLPIRWEILYEGGERLTGKYSALKLDEPMKPDDFKWEPPKDAKSGDGG